MLLGHIHAAQKIWVGSLPVHCNVQCAFPMLRLQDICLQELSMQNGSSRCQPTRYGDQLLCLASYTISLYKRCFHFRNCTEYIVLFYSNLLITFCVVKVYQLAKKITYIESTKPDNIRRLVAEATCQ